VLPKTAFRGANGEIKETITTGTIRANNLTINPYNSNSKNNESAIIENERNFKQCRYCKNIGHKIKECRKLQYNNSWNNSSEETHETSRDQRTDLERA